MLEYLGVENMVVLVIEEGCCFVEMVVGKVEVVIVFVN